MAISVVYNAAGDILSAHEVPGHTGAETTLHLVAGPGEHHALLDVPPHHQGKRFADYAHLLRVHTNGGAPRLQDK